MTPAELTLKLQTVTTSLTKAKSDLLSFKSLYSTAKTDFNAIATAINGNEVTVLLDEINTIVTALG